MRELGGVLLMLLALSFNYLVSLLMHRDVDEGEDPPEPLRSMLQEYARDYPIKENDE